MSLQMHLEAVIELVGRYTLMPLLIKIEVTLEVGRLGEKHDGSGDSLYWLTENFVNVQCRVHYGLPGDKEPAVSRRAVYLAMM